MKIGIGSDHAGFQYKELLKDHLIKLGHEVKDFGTHSEEMVDYPLFIRPTAEAVRETPEQRRREELERRIGRDEQAVGARDARLVGDEAAQHVRKYRDDDAEADRVDGDGGEDEEDSGLAQRAGLMDAAARPASRPWRWQPGRRGRCSALRPVGRC